MQYRNQCVALCRLNVERIVQNTDLWRKGLGDDVWQLIEEVAKAIDKANFTVKPHKQPKARNVKEFLEILESKVDYLTQEVRELMEARGSCDEASPAPDVKRRRKQYRKGCT